MNRVLLPILLLILSVSIWAQPGTPTFPTAIDTATSLLDINNNASTTLSGGISGGDTTINVANAAAFATTGALTIDAEIILYTTKAGNQFTGLTRGAFGTSAASHSNGVAVRQNVLAQHFKARSTAIIAAETKIGSGVSTPLAGTVLSGTGTGTSAWQTLNGTPSTDFVLGNGTPSSFQFRFLVSSSGSKPGIRYDSGKWQFSNDGSTWSDLGGGVGSGLSGSGAQGAIPVFIGPTTLSSSVISQSGDTVTLSGNLRLIKKLAAGGQSSLFLNAIGYFAEFWTSEAAGNGIEIENFVNTTGTVTPAVYGARASVFTTNSAAFTSEVAGGSFRTAHTGSGSFATAIGVRGDVLQASSSATITSAKPFDALYLHTGAGTTTTLDMFHARSQTFQGTVTTLTNFRATNPVQTGGTLNAYYGIQIDDADAVTATTKRAIWSKGGIVLLEKLTLDVGERAAPSVSASNTGRIYFDSTSKKFRVSENTGAYVDLVGSGGGGSAWSAITSPSGNQSLSMNAHLTTWTWNATTGTNDLLSISNSSNDTGTNSLVLIQTPGASNTKIPLKVRARGADSFVIDSTGATTIFGDTKTSANGSSTGTPRLAGIGDLDGTEAVRLLLGDTGSLLQNSSGGRMSVQSFWGMILSGSRQTLTPRAFESGASGDSSVTILSENAARTPLDVNSSLTLTAPIFRAFNNGTLKFQVIAGGTFVGVNTVQSGSGSQNFDLSLGNVHRLTATGNITALTVSNLQNSTVYTFVLKQDATGGRTLTGVSSTFKFPGGSIPSLTSAANSTDIWRCVADNSLLYCLPYLDVK